MNGPTVEVTSGELRSSGKVIRFRWAECNPYPQEDLKDYCKAVNAQPLLFPLAKSSQILFLVLDPVSGFPRPPFTRHLIILIGVDGKNVDYTKTGFKKQKRKKTKKSKTETHWNKIINRCLVGALAESMGIAWRGKVVLEMGVDQTFQKASLHGVPPTGQIGHNGHNFLVD